MALFHLSVTQTKRSAGQSAIASAAYRAGERLYSEILAVVKHITHTLHISSIELPQSNYPPSSVRVITR